MNVVDSSGWLEYFADGPNADFFAPALEAHRRTDCAHDQCVRSVQARVLQQRSESEALQAVAVMMRGRGVDLDVQFALTAARISAQLRIPMADSILLATARGYDATLWTQDEHFEHIEGIQYRAKLA